MSLPPQKFREIVFQILYSFDMGSCEEEALGLFLMKELKVTRRSIREAQERKNAIWAQIEDLDTVIRQSSTSYDFERISRVERNILRLGLYEMLYDEATPKKVAMSEAIRLTRKFGTPESAHFVNAVLDAVYQKQQPTVCS